MELYQGLDILVNNAGAMYDVPIEETSEEQWDFVYSVNVKGAFLGIKSAIPIMKKSGGGSIINLSSMAAL